MTAPPPGGARGGMLRSHWAAAALFSVVAVIVHTWPLATNPARHSLNSNGDVMLNEWIVAWVQHQLPRDPLNLFAANIFHPAKDSLAFSEPLIVPALLGWPAALLGGSPVLVHNLLLLAGLALTLLAGYALAWRWTGDPLASLVAASAWTFNTQSLVRLEHLQAAHAYGIPLSLLFADRLVTAGHRRDALLLAGVMVMMACTSGYLVIFSTVAIAILLVVRAGAWLPRWRQVIGGFTRACVLAGVAVIPLALPYRRAAVEQGMLRPLESVAQFSATIDGYVASYSRLHHWLWNAGAPREFPDAFFPGAVIVLLALVGCAGMLAGDERGARRRFLLALCAVGVVLSLGTRTPVYGWLYAVFPPLAGLRAASRFGLLFLLGTAMLAAFGMAAIRARIASRTRSSAIALALLAIVHIEAARAPFTYTPFRGIPGVYELLRREPGRVVLVEAPFYLPEVVFQNAEYVLNSTAHWRPLMNGYSGYTPAMYREFVREFWHFPAPRAIAAMRAAGATHVMVHPLRYGSEADQTMRQLLASPQLERLAVGRDNLTLFRIR